MTEQACEFVDNRLRRCPPDRAGAVPYGQAGKNALRFPHLAHRSAAAHKLHSATATSRIEFDSGKGETLQPATGLSLFFPEPVQTTGTTAYKTDMRAAMARHRFSWLEPIWAVAIYCVHHAAVAKAPCLRIEIVKRTDGMKGFVVLPRRRVAERTFSWFGRNPTTTICRPRRSAPSFSNSLPGGSRRPCASNAALPVTASRGQPGHCRLPILNGSALTGAPHLGSSQACRLRPTARRRATERRARNSRDKPVTSGRYSIVFIFQAQRCVRQQLQGEA